MDGPKALSSNEKPTKIHCPEYQNNSYYLGNTAYNYSLENTHTYYLYYHCATNIEQNK